MVTSIFFLDLINETALESSVSPSLISNESIRWCLMRIAENYLVKIRKFAGTDWIFFREMLSFYPNSQIP